MRKNLVGRRCASRLSWSYVHGNEEIEALGAREYIYIGGVRLGKGGYIRINPVGGPGAFGLSVVPLTWG